MKAFTADWICPVSAPPIRNGVLVVDGDRIVAVTDTVPEGSDPVAFEDAVLVPGLVNTHIHLELTLLRGFLEDIPFLPWLRQLTRAKYESLEREDLALSARLGVMECLSGGITTLGEVMDIGTGLEAMAGFGLRGVAYQEVFGPAEDQAAVAIEHLEARIQASRPYQDVTRRVGVSPHAPYTVSAGLYRRVQAVARAGDLPVAVHIAESEAETRFVMDGAGPFGESWKRRRIPLVPRGVGPIRYLADLGLLDSRTLAIHAVEATAEDIEILRSRGTAIAHCPKSNLKLGHGIAPLAEFLSAGIPVGLGSDSVASNNVVDMFEEMRTAVFLQRSRRRDAAALSAADALGMATLGGARCLGLDDRLGSLEPGKLADFVVVGLDDPARTPVYDPVNAMVFTANRDSVRATFLGGERVEIDPADTMREARRTIERRGLAPAAKR